MAIFRKILNFFIKTALVLLLLCLFFYLDARKIVNFDPRAFLHVAGIADNQQVKLLPNKENPKNVSFKWTYAGKSYEINETLYGSSYDFYAAQPKSFSYFGELPTDWREQYFKRFITAASGDETFQKIADDIRNAGLKNGLSKDQIADLAMAFVQSIPYDDVRAKEILVGQGDNLTHYPYETLYEGRGVCSDKSFLAYILLHNLGYGTALFVYESENHMAVAVQCPDQYANYGSGYCYAETTASGERIGMIPSLNAADNRVQPVGKAAYFNDDQQSKFDAKKLGSVEIYEKQAGASYAGIADTLKISREVDDISNWLSDSRQQIKSAQTRIKTDEAVLSNLKDSLDKLMKAKDYVNYNQLVPKYNALASSVKKEIQDYNAKINQYNQKIVRYNSLIQNL